VKLILAGRTQEAGDKTFGIAVFEAAMRRLLVHLLENDPAVVAGLMTAELHSFASRPSVQRIPDAWSCNRLAQARVDGRQAGLDATADVCHKIGSLTSDLRFLPLALRLLKLNACAT